MGGGGDEEEVAFLDDSAKVGKTALNTMASQRTTESFIIVRVATQKKKKKSQKDINHSHVKLWRRVSEDASHLAWARQKDANGSNDIGNGRFVFDG